MLRNNPRAREEEEQGKRVYSGSEPENPCITCGACCAAHKVIFYWHEAWDIGGGDVPEELTRKISEVMVCMKGTDKNEPRCIALQGTVGKDATCTIYPNRPSACRLAGIDWKNGLWSATEEGFAICVKSRERYQLPQLAADHQPVYSEKEETPAADGGTGPDPETDAPDDKPAAPQP